MLTLPSTYYQNLQGLKAGKMTAKCKPSSHERFARAGGSIQNDILPLVKFEHQLQLGA
jgi:hypothetical protein